MTFKHTFFANFRIHFYVLYHLKFNYKELLPSNALNPLAILSLLSFNFQKGKIRMIKYKNDINIETSVAFLPCICLSPAAQQHEIILARNLAIRSDLILITKISKREIFIIITVKII